MASIADTTVEMVQFGFPEHAGAPGRIQGGRMREWITEAGTMAAARVAPATAGEARLFEEAQARRAERLERFGARKKSAASSQPDDDDVRWSFESVRSVLPEDALFDTVMFPGKMLKDIDEAGGILSM